MPWTAPGERHEIEPARSTVRASSQHDGLALPHPAPRADHGDRWSRGHHCDRQYIRTARPRELAGFAPTKAAQRILAEAMARDLGPKGVHVAYIVIDAVIDVPWAPERFKTKPDDFFIAPRNCRLSVARCKPAPLGMVVQRRGQTIRRGLVVQTCRRA